MSRTISVPASGWLGMGMPYQYIQAGETFKEDKWITAVEVRPEFRPAVHHIIAFIVPPGKTLLDIGGDDFGRNMLGAFVPGDDPIIMPPGFARKVLKGSKIIFELHYTPMGKPGKDCSMAGLCFSSEAPKHEVFGDAIFNARFAIPPGAANHEVKSTKTFKKETVLLAPGAAHARPRQVVPLRSPDAGRQERNASERAEVRFQLAVELPPGDAADDPGRLEDHLHGSLRQFARRTRSIRTPKRESAGAPRPGKR